MTNLIRNLVSKEKHRYQADGFDLDLSYVTPRLIAMGYPSDKLEGIYRNKMSEVRRFFNQKHVGHYKVYNLCSERSYSPKHFQNATASFPFDDHNPCEFHMLIQFCEDAKTYLDQDPKNIIAVHCKAGKGRTGLVLCCYLQFTKESASAQEALTFYAEARTKDRKGVTIPSQIRWVQHFGTYLQRYRWLNRPLATRGVPVVIERVEIHGYPAHFDPGCILPHVKILKMDKSVVWDSKVNAQPIKWFKVSPLCPIKCEAVVTGDFHLVCYHNDKKLFGFWDHSSFLCQEDDKENKQDNEYHLSYKKSELDGAAKDCKRHEKFPKEFRVVLVCRPVAAIEGDTGEGSDDESKKSKETLMGKVRNPLKKLVSKKKLRFQQDGFDLDLSYITPTIVAMGFPSINLEGMYRNKMSDVVKFVRFYHEGHYKVYNLCSERTYTAENFQNNCASYPFDDHNPCPFKTLVKFCEDAMEFGKRDPKNCRLVHCKAGKGRTGLVIAALMLLEGTCPTADKALEFYGGKRTSNVKGVTIPSQRRGGGCTPYFKISTMDKTVLYNHKVEKRGKLVKWKKTQPGWACQCQVQLQGDVHVTFYDSNSKMFGFWIYTTFIKTQSIVLQKEDLDGASNDKRHEKFAENFNCQVFFSGVVEEQRTDASVPGFRSHVMTASPSDLMKWASATKEAKDDTARPEGEDEEAESTSEEQGHEISDDEYLEGNDHPEEESEDEKEELAIQAALVPNPLYTGGSGSRTPSPGSKPPPPPPPAPLSPTSAKVPPPPPPAPPSPTNTNALKPRKKRDTSPGGSPGQSSPRNSEGGKDTKGPPAKASLSVQGPSSPASPDLKPQQRRSGVGPLLLEQPDHLQTRSKALSMFQRTNAPDKPAPSRPSLIATFTSHDRHHNSPQRDSTPRELPNLVSKDKEAPVLKDKDRDSLQDLSPKDSPLVGPPLDGDEKRQDPTERRISTAPAPTKKAPSKPLPNNKPANVVIHRPASRRSSLPELPENQEEPPPPPPPPSEVVSQRPQIQGELDKVTAELDALTQVIPSYQADPKTQTLLEGSRSRLMELQASLRKKLATALESDNLATNFENTIFQIGARLSDDRPDWLKIMESCGYTAAERAMLLERMKALRK